MRRLSLADMDDASRVLRVSYDHALPWLAGRHTPREDRAFFRDQVIVKNEVWGAIDGGLIGFIAFRDDWVDHLYVLPKRQGEGVGDALLRLAKARSPDLSLWTFRKNRAARAFYEKRGFTAVRTTDGSGNGDGEPDILYRWEAGSGA